jgi:hypothetical protein
VGDGGTGVAVGTVVAVGGGNVGVGVGGGTVAVGVGGSVARAIVGDGVGVGGRVAVGDGDGRAHETTSRATIATNAHRIARWRLFWGIKMGLLFSRTKVYRYYTSE